MNKMLKYGIVKENEAKNEGVQKKTVNKDDLTLRSWC